MKNEKDHDINLIISILTVLNLKCLLVCIDQITCMNSNAKLNITNKNIYKRMRTWSQVSFGGCVIGVKYCCAKRC